MILQLQRLAQLCLYALPIWAALRGIWFWLGKPHRIKPLREAAMALFVVFMAGLMVFVLEGQWLAPGEALRVAIERIRTGDRIHLRLFQTIGPQLELFPREDAAMQLLGNTLLFAPWGFFLPLLWPRFRVLRRMALMALLLTLSIECTQLFIDRYVEVDDVLLNFLGAMLGTGVWKLLHRLFPGIDHYLL